ncbi:MAG: insulinase family protein, partial [Chloroflexia bacterium]|nr:insulinase family protein [Chloroflexia bacterium]
AYTSFDETVYMLQLPTDKPDLFNKGLLVLEDWAHNVALEDEEIEKERGVIIEEWRLGLGANERMRQKYFPVLLKGSRYAERLPIGKKEVVEKCNPQLLRDFYKDWYRTDLMAVVVVGDVDVAES